MEITAAPASTAGSISDPQPYTTPTQQQSAAQAQQEIIIPDTVASLDEVPAKLQSSYFPSEDGNYVFRSAAQLKKALDTERASATTASKNEKSLAAQLNSVLETLGVDPNEASDLESLRTLISEKVTKTKVEPQQPAENQAIQQQAIQSALAEASAKHKKELIKETRQREQVTAKFEQLQNNYKENLLQFAIGQAFAESGLHPSKEGKKALPTLIQQELVVVEEDGVKFSVYVKPTKADVGMEWRINSDGDAMTVAEFLESHMSTTYPSLFETAVPASGTGHALPNATSSNGILQIKAEEFKKDRGLYKRLKDSKQPFTTIY